MIFATYWFLAFAVIFFPLFWLCRNPALRLGLLLAVSAIFHTHYAGPAGVIPIVIMGIIVYAIGLLENRIANALGIVLCVLMLIAYKYCVFLSANLLAMVNAEMGAKVSETLRTTLPTSPPLAISFFTFEFVHYLVDRRRGTPPIRRPVDFALFAIFFPTLVAGPIKRYEQFLPSLRAGVAKVCSRDVMNGLIQACLGCAKKVCADNLTIWLEHSQDKFTALPLAGRWLLFAAVAFRILLDFSGYSDIAIGLARMMGIAIPANFNWPYLSTNIREFWHRWHISLSTWIRDYIYIPLGGSRHGNVRRFLNGLAAFSLCGLWHGAGWNFMLWGLYHGLGLSVSHFYRELPLGIGRTAEKVFTVVPVLGWVVTLLFVWLGWLLFFFPVPKAWEMAVHLFVPT
ncbi:MAG TPA: MBOAT family O-acyltransferase [Terrimicrobiaceae bacterium]